jgi:hypothetical protein
MPVNYILIVHLAGVRMHSFNLGLNKFLNVAFSLFDDVHEEIQGGLPWTDMLLPKRSALTMASEAIQSHIIMPGLFDNNDIGDLWLGSEMPAHTALGPSKEGTGCAEPTSVHDQQRTLDLVDHELDAEPDAQLDEDGWHNFEPPTVLRKVPVAVSHIILDIVSDSIENIRLPVQEAEQRRHEEKQQLEAEAARQKELKGNEAYLPIIIAEEEGEVPLSVPGEQDIQKQSPGFDLPDRSDLPAMSGPRRANSQSSIWPMLREEKKHRLAIRRLFKRHDKEESGEGSAAGAAREACEALRSRLEVKLMSHLNIDNADPTTQETIEALRKVGIFKGPDPKLLV